jgi:uncharacterized phage infection (PIP) family protein YhgE
MRKHNLLCIVSALLFCVSGLSAQASQPVSFGMVEARQELNSLQSERSLLMQTYRQILTQYSGATPNLNETTQASQPNSPAQTPTMTSSPQSSTQLQDLLNQGDNLFKTLDGQLAGLQTQLADSETTITSLQASLNQAKQTIARLSQNLTKAQDWANQMGQRLQENNEDLSAAYDNLDTLSQQNADLKQRAAGLQAQAGRSGLIGFCFAGIGYGAGMPLILEGIRADNQTMLWSGAGAIIGSTGIWLLGRYLCGWW